MPTKSSYSNTNDYDSADSDYNNPYDSSTYDKDCSDFDTWDDAQDYYENVADDNLDGDGDGVACENLQ